MSTADLWDAVQQQALAWSTLEEVRFVRGSLPRTAIDRRDQLPKTLHHLQASGLQVTGTPLRLGTQLPAFLNGMPPIDVDLPRTELEGFTRRALAVESAHRMTLAWLRSRLPGYPLLPAPQLAPGAPLTTNEFTWRLVWTRDELAAQLHLASAPPGVDTALSLGRSDALRLAAAASDVASSLAATPEWDGFVAATTELDAASRTELLECRANIKARLAPAEIDAFEPRFALRRSDYREATVHDALATLSGRARSYADAFDLVDRLLERACSDVFGQLVFYGVPGDRLSPLELNLLPGAVAEVDLLVRDVPAFPETGTLTWVDSPLVPDAIRIVAVSMQFDVVEGESFRLRGEILAGTSAAWRS